MDRISVTLSEDMITRLSDLVTSEYESRSEAVRELLEKGFEYDERMNELEQQYESRITEIRSEYEDRLTEYEAEIEQVRTEYEDRINELEDRIDVLETENERLNNEKRLILQQREETTELVRAAERQQDWIERQARAGLLTKTKWAIFGMPDADAESDEN